MNRRFQLASLFAALAIAPAIFADSITNAPFPVTITVDAARPVGGLTPIWRFFGADEADYAYMKDGKKLLSELGQLGGQQVYFRAHHLLTSGDGAYALKWSSTSAYKEDTNGTPIYDWTHQRQDFRHLPRTRREALRANRFHAGGALDASAKLSAQSAGQ